MEKKITIAEIAEALKNKNYKIEHDSACDCSIDRIDHNGAEISGNECWHQRELWIGDYQIACYIQHYGVSAGSGCPDDYDPRDLDDDYPEIWQEICIADDEANPSHDLERIWLSELEDRAEQGWRYYRDDERGFANEYTVYLVAPGAGESEISEDWDTISAEEAAAAIAYRGDAATQAYNKLRVIK